ncbi:glutathione S-transferase [Salinisphaera sp. PC39]|uniref:glutathione S-transferase family protein n=1 Tax=Salinisphaera sp. PC39 TaxID=1304156 RepID=UPI00333E345C
MTHDLVLYTNPMSRGRIARWMLEETGAPYRTEILAYGDAMKSPGYLAINPMGKVPAVTHGARVVTECPAICAYLADAFPGAGLAPSTADRAAYYRWLFFAAGPLEAAVTNKAIGAEPGEDQRRMVGYGSLATVLDVLEDALSDREYIAGERFSAADVYLGSHIGWGMQWGTIDQRRVFTDYWQRLAERPACRRAKQLDDEAMEGTDH